MNTLNDLLTQSPLLYNVVTLTAIIIAAWLANFVTRRVTLRIIDKIASRYFSKSHEALSKPLASRLANIVPVIVIAAGANLTPNLPEILVRVVNNVSLACIALTLAIAVSHLIDYMNLAYMQKKDSSKKPIKGYLQVVKLAIYIITAVIIISSLIDKNPLILLSGLGAMAAVLMLIFQDTILSLVASIQIGASGIVRIGDWIEMPQVNADGDVVDIALHTVTVQNWDKTYTVFPTKKLVSEAFKNWRGMQESGGRRIKRSLYLDQTSVRFLEEDEIAALHRFMVLDEYLDKKAAELKAWNEQLLQQGRDPINARRVTNIGTFRAYVNHYLRQHPRIHQGMTILVRQMQPGATGLPLEIYCFTNTTAWLAYEDIQSDIFDHLLAILPRFGLRVFQEPSGSDIAALAGKREIKRLEG